MDKDSLAVELTSMAEKLEATLGWLRIGEAPVNATRDIETMQARLAAIAEGNRPVMYLVCPSCEV